MTRLRKYNLDLQGASLSQENETLTQEKKIQRPNIDHLIKRIMLERRKERKNNITTLILTISLIAIISYLFTINS
jgi:dolichol kinase|tara:strand:- start:388 stop:612 length:225 start_codon:yes stop_codon:yes gene_type:complete